MKIVIVPYDPQWGERYEVLREKIVNVLGDDAMSIEHIGSTSIEGLAAKPVIDIQVGVKDKATLETIIAPMIKAGFTYGQKYEHLLPERKYFIQYKHADGHTPPEILINDTSLNGFVNTAHIHCWVMDSGDWVRHLAFRDYLRAHKDVRLEYQMLKELLSKQEWESSLEYSQAKNDFIKRVEKIAMEWYRNKY